MKIILVEDSELIRDRLRAKLSAIQDADIIGEAITAENAIADIKELNPDLVILDIKLKVGSGIDVLKGIGKVNFKPGAPKIIILTNFLNPQYRQACEKQGVDYFFDKTTQFFECIDVVAKLAGDKSMKGRG